MYIQPKLAYSLDALEPYLDRENLDIHYNKHHVTYVNKFNDAVKGTSYENIDLKELLTKLNDIKDEKLRNSIKNMGGGAWNHSFFWEVLCPVSFSGKPGENTIKTLEESFGSFEEFKKQFKEVAVSVFGSGWAWLVVGKNEKLEIIKTANQECPLTAGLKPILTIDVWEHAYYLKYRNLRVDFVDAFFNVINWKKVEENLG
jgi:Fe-Mn family superoxide dismutase